MKKIKKILKLIFINVLVLFVLIVVANFLSIIIYKTYKSTNEYSDSRAKLPNYNEIEWTRHHFEELKELKAEYQSYIGWRMLKYSGKTINIDKDGIRNTPQHNNVSQNSSSVVFLGGSTAWGVGADDKNTIPALISEMGEGRFKTLNYGEHSYRAFQGYLFLMSQINKGIKPDIVISYDGVNEKAGFEDNHKPTSHSRENQLRVVMRGQDTNKAEEELMSFKNFFFGPLNNFISKFKTNKTLISSKENQTSERRTELVARALLDAWMASKSLAEENGALFFCVLQPVSVVGSPNLEYLKINPERIKMYNQLYSKVLKLINTPDYNVLSDNFIDLRNVLDGQDKYFIDFCHLSPNGNKVIANNLFLEINNRIENFNR